MITRPVIHNWNQVMRHMRLKFFPLADCVTNDVQVFWNPGTDPIHLKATDFRPSVESEEPQITQRECYPQCVFGLSDLVERSTIANPNTPGKLKAKSSELFQAHDRILSVGVKIWPAGIEARGDRCVHPRPFRAGSLPPFPLLVSP